MAHWHSKQFHKQFFTINQINIIYCNADKVKEHLVTCLFIKSSLIRYFTILSKILDTSMTYTNLRMTMYKKINVVKKTLHVFFTYLYRIFSPSD